jgi:putative zinc finger protein
MTGAHAGFARNVHETRVQRRHPTLYETGPHSGVVVVRRPARPLANSSRDDQDLPHDGAIVTCREFADFMGDYLSGELLPALRGPFDHHLSLCVNCQRYLASYRETVALGKQAFTDADAALPADVPEELVKAILAARSSR